jgi:hypothetical protein
MGHSKGDWDLVGANGVVTTITMSSTVYPGIVRLSA